jgi:hypothetical protein
MAELHLDRLAHRGERQQLVAEADAEGRHLRATSSRIALDRVIARLGIAGAVGEEDAVRLQRQHLGGGGGGRQHGEAAAALGQHAQDVALDAVVEGDDMKRGSVRLAIAGAELPLAFAPFVGRRRVTTLARSMPARPGETRARPPALRASSTAPAMMQPLCAPFSRRMRVSLRVSMSAIATMFWPEVIGQGLGGCESSNAGAARRAPPGRPRGCGRLRRPRH